MRSLALACAMVLVTSPAFAVPDAAVPDAAVSGSSALSKNLDDSVAACDDFYVYANGLWLKNNPIPAAYASWGTFNELEKRNSERLKVIIAEVSEQADAAQGSVPQQLGDFFRSGVNEAELEKRALGPIRAELDAIAKIKRRADVVAQIVQMHAAADPVLFNLGIRQDLKDNTRMLVYAGQGGLGLPNRDFYLRDDAESKAMLANYATHIANMLALAGSTRKDAAKAAERIVAFERKLAQTHLPREAMRDPNNSYRVVAVGVAEREVAMLPWRQLFQALGAKQLKQFSLPHPDFFRELDRALRKEPLSLWRDYLTWNVLRDAAPYLDKAIAEENFRFYRTQLAGQKEQRPRDERVIEQMNLLLGEPLGQLFVAKHFPPEAKARMMEMIGNLKLALRTRLENLAWMSPETRKQAMEKWATFTPKIGYPDRWRDYSSVKIVADDYYGNVRRLQAFDQAFDIAKLGKPVDKSEWGMPPQQVNAYYNPLWNEIAFPAGILQPPFFDMAADDALNYGAIGAVIGHELLHGFDDSGSRFDAQGRLRMWWTEEDRKAFDARAKRLVEQAGEFVAIGDMRLNGQVSLGENIADLGGLQVAYLALETALKDRPQAAKEGFSAEQRFFFGWAQVWRRNWTEAALKLQVNTGPHAPGKFRVNGPLSNLAEFKSAFSCKEGDPMVRKEATRVSIW